MLDPYISIVWLRKILLKSATEDMLFSSHSISQLNYVYWLCFHQANKKIRKQNKASDISFTNIKRKPLQRSLLHW